MTGKVAWRATWTSYVAVPEIHVSATEDLQLITTEEDPMEPLLSSGDRILVDVKRTVSAPSGSRPRWDRCAEPTRIPEAPRGVGSSNSKGASV